MIKKLICLIWGHKFTGGVKFLGIQLVKPICTRCYKEYKEPEKPKTTDTSVCPHNEDWEDCPDCRH